MLLILLTFFFFFFATEDYDAFFEARENNAVYAFLGLTAPPGSKVWFSCFIGHFITAVLF